MKVPHRHNCDEQVKRIGVGSTQGWPAHGTRAKKGYGHAAWIMVTVGDDCNTEKTVTSVLNILV